jgi:hypothetical protein
MRLARTWAFLINSKGAGVVSRCSVELDWELTRSYCRYGTGRSTRQGKTGNSSHSGHATCFVDDGKWGRFTCELTDTRREAVLGLLIDTERNNAYNRIAKKWGIEACTKLATM